MKQAQFDIATRGTPIYYPVFRVIAVPDRIKGQRELLEVGDIVWWNRHRSCMVKVKDSICIVLTCKSLEFLNYFTAAEMEAI